MKESKVIVGEEKIGQDANGELEKGKMHLVEGLVEYIPNAVLCRTIIKKSTGNITAMSFDEGEEMGEKSVPFDTYIQIIHGAAQIKIDKMLHCLSLGAGIVIPAHQMHWINAAEKFKMISTVIKSGYDVNSSFSTT